MWAGGELWPFGIRFRRTLAMTVFVAVAGGREARAQPSEYAIKAEFIERFTRFIDWPEDAFSSPTSPFVLCVMGDNPFGDYLGHLARDRKIKDRSVRLVFPTKVSELTACHLLFVAASEAAKVRAIVQRTRGAPILTVGDTPGFAEIGVLVNFFFERDLVRFEINVDEGRRSGLAFSAKLLKLARIVHAPQETP
jgi:hypothetical protein